VQWWSVAACAVAVLFVITNDRYRPWAITAALLLFWTLQGALRTTRRDEPRADVWEAAEAAERQGWESGGNPGRFPPNWGPSPWLRALAHHRAGQDTTARALLLQSLERDTGLWVPPSGATLSQLGPLVDLLPADPPVTYRPGAVVYLSILEQLGPAERSRQYLGRLLAAHPPTAA
jgi:hypothetical protein